MAGIFTRRAISSILNNEDLTPEERTDQLFSLYGRALDDGYITKSAAQAATDAAVEAAKTQAIKDYQPPNVLDSNEYKTLLNDFNKYKEKQDARLSADFSEVKPKFFDAVYDRLDRSENAKPITEQLAEIKNTFEEYFNPTTTGETKPTKPQFGEQAQGAMPTGEGEGSFAKYWGYTRKD